MSPWTKVDPSRIKDALGVPGPLDLTYKTCPSAGSPAWLKLPAPPATPLPETAVRMNEVAGGGQRLSIKNNQKHSSLLESPHWLNHMEHPLQKTQIHEKTWKGSRSLPFPNTSCTGTFSPKAKILVKRVAVVPAPTMAFSLPSAYMPCSFTSRGFIFSPRSSAVDKKLFLFFASAEA